MNQINETMGQRLKRLREQCAMTQKELAAATDLAQNTISYIENDARGYSGRAVVHIAQVLNTTAEYLLMTAQVPTTTPAPAHKVRHVASSTPKQTDPLARQRANFLDNFSSTLESLTNATELRTAYSLAAQAMDAYIESLRHPTHPTVEAPPHPTSNHPIHPESAQPLPSRSATPLSVPTPTLARNP